MFDSFVGLVHIILSFLISIYFVWRKSSYDIYFIIYFAIINISWVILNNECLISYIYKLFLNADYQLGDNSEVQDYNIWLGDAGANIFLNYVLIMYSLNMIYILLSDCCHAIKVPVFLSLIMYLFYVVSIRTNGLNKSLIGRTNLVSNLILLSGIIFNYKKLI
jgi:hypothetical protein